MENSSMTPEQMQDRIDELEKALWRLPGTRAGLGLSPLASFALGLFLASAAWALVAFHALAEWESASQALLESSAESQVALEQLLADGQ